MKKSLRVHEKERYTRVDMLNSDTFSWKEFKKKKIARDSYVIIISSDFKKKLWKKPLQSLWLSIPYEKITLLSPSFWQKNVWI